MAANDQLQTLADLRRDFQFRLREVEGVTVTNNASDRFLNIALHDIHTAPGEVVPWAVRRGVIQTHAPYSTGTVAIALSTRTTVTGTSTEWDTAVTGMGFNNAQVGGKLTFAGASDVYTVSAVGSDTSITLSDRFIGSSALSGESYSYFEDEYALASDYFSIVDARTFSISWGIPFIGPQEFYRQFPKNTVTGRPKIATLIQLEFSSSTTPQHRVIFSPVPDQIYMIPYHFITSNLAVSAAGALQVDMDADTDEPIIPVRYRALIVLHALFNWYRDRKADDRATEAKAEYVDLFRRVKRHSQVGQDHPRFQPVSYFERGGMVGRRRFQTGSEWDELKI